MRVTECAEQRPRFEVEALGSGLMLLRLYEDEQRVQHEDVSGMDTPHEGWRYTTYEMRTQLPDGALDTAPDAWAAVIKRADYAAAAAEVRAERDKRIAATDWTVLGDAKTAKADWREYRQALRDVPEQAGFPYAVQWPTRPAE